MNVEQQLGLNEPPFRISPDPRFLYLSDQVKEAIAKCEYMARHRVGPLYIYGPIGSGKTTILRRMYESFRDDALFNVSMLILPNIKTTNSLLRIIMDEFGVKTERAYDRSLRNLERFLIDERKAGRIPLLLVDEAQNMTRDALRLVHYLLNFETQTAKLLQIVLVGQEELASKITRFPELASRMFPIAMNAMSPAELRKMIEFRVMVAGGASAPFAPEAYGTIFERSKGLPRDAVRICDEALRFLVANRRSVISSGDVATVATALNLAT